VTLHLWIHSLAIYFVCTHTILRYEINFLSSETSSLTHPLWFWCLVSWCERRTS